VLKRRTITQSRSAPGGRRAPGARPSPSSRRRASFCAPSARRRGGRPRRAAASRWSPYTSDVEATSTRLRNLVQYQHRLGALHVRDTCAPAAHDQPRRPRGEVEDDVGPVDELADDGGGGTDSTERWKSSRSAPVRRCARRRSRSSSAPPPSRRRAARTGAS
jgi:hypothetical protein